ncbi:hypothetical protein EV649_3505 [Kribbella sp. VKM Ac-2569]|uniref:hypothetical protein n=1 Tax=Kribbella sp. VKM Ac-2569 TaxID=2512220 RepID=UPI00102BDB0F|nr:hypothetical protein [Kribbella sp. VKM Ac-2569]RZT20358.1 hypothetical protein EV649_3505 [Kribbella sp. VKM Ac-2569]
MKLRHRTTMACGAALLAMTAAVPAAAAPIERGHFEDAGNGVIEDFCGSGDDVHFDFTNWGSFQYRTNPRGGLPYFRENAHLTNTLTNLSNDKVVTHVLDLVHKDTQVTDNGDGTLTIRIRETAGDRWFDSSGRLVLQDSGAVWFDILVDNGGTPTNPFDDEFIDSLGDVKVVGQEGNATDENFCDKILAIIG